MRVIELVIENLRNLGECRIEAGADLNWLYGPNGAGKTSVLEAMSILARGRSFRAGGPRAWIGAGGGEARVFARVRGKHRTVRLGLERSASGWRGAVNGEPVRSLAEMARHLPLVVFEPGAHTLVEGGPEERRRFMDWGVFHVEHGFLDTWRDFTRLLKQRNAALRTGAAEAVLNSLEPGYVEAASRLGAYRKRYIAEVSAELESIQSALLADLSALELSYFQGWQQGRDLGEALQSSRDRDREQGFTQQGPHRADLRIRLGQRAVRHVLSRGQQKQTALLLLLGQYRQWQARLTHTPVLLLDDLNSELDADHRDRVLTWLRDDRGQVWITGTEPPHLRALPRQPDTRVFHVEQGSLSSVQTPGEGQDGV